MKKNTKSHVDNFVAENLCLTLRDETITIKNIIAESLYVEAIYFLYFEEGIFWVDEIEVVSNNDGFKVKPRRIEYSDCTLKKINKHVYRRWYCSNGVELFRLKPMNGSSFVANFGNPSDVIITPQPLF